MSKTGVMPLTKIITLLWIVLNYNAALIIAASSVLWEPNGFVLEVYASSKTSPFWSSVGRVQNSEGILQVGKQADQTTLHWRDGPVYVSPAPDSTVSVIVRAQTSLLVLGDVSNIKWIVSDAKLDSGPKSLIIQPDDGIVYGCDPTGMIQKGTKFIHQPDQKKYVPPCDTKIFFKVLKL